MWYEKDKKDELDYSKPIVVELDNGIGVLLIPIIDTSKRNFDIIGYDWFNLNEGRFQSCRHFKTPQEAVECYEKDFVVRNAYVIY